MFKKIIIFIIIGVAVIILSIIGFIIELYPSNHWNSVIKQILSYIFVIVAICFVVYTLVKYLNWILKNYLSVKRNENHLAFCEVR